MNTFISTDNFACLWDQALYSKEIDNSLARCTHSHPVSSIYPLQLLERNFQVLQCYSIMTTAMKSPLKLMEFACVMQKAQK